MMILFVECNSDGFVLTWTLAESIKDEKIQLRLGVFKAEDGDYYSIIDLDDCDKAGADYDFIQALRGIEHLKEVESPFGEVYDNLVIKLLAVGMKLGQQAKTPMPQ